MNTDYPEAYPEGRDAEIARLTAELAAVREEYRNSVAVKAEYIGGLRRDAEFARVQRDEARAELAASQERERVLREWMLDCVVEDGCKYGDNCTDDAMRRHRHGRCLCCSARAALGEP